MSLNRQVCLVLATAGVSLGVAVMAPSALAAGPFTVGTSGGDDPAVAIDTTGTAHVVFKVNGSSPMAVANTPLEICNIPHGGTACATTASLVAPSTGDTAGAFNFSTISNATYGTPAIVSDGSDLDVISTYYIEGVSPGDNQDDLELEWQSTDGGVTWSAPAAIGTFDNFVNDSVNGGENIIADPVDDLFVSGPWGHPGGAFGEYNVQADPAATTFPATDTATEPPALELNQAGPNGVSDVTPFAALTPNPPSVPGNGLGTLTASIGQGGGSLVGVWDNAQNGYDFNYAYLKSGVSTTAANIDNSANWTVTHMPAGVDLADASLTGGATGPFLLNDAKEYPAVSTWNQKTGTFLPAARVDCGDAAISGAGMQSENLSEAPTGALQLVYSTSTNFVAKLKYADLGLSENGLVQNYPLTLSTGGQYHEPRIAVNASSQGLVVWDDPSVSSTPIRAVWLPTPLPTHTALPDCRFAAARTVSGLHVTVTASTAPRTFGSSAPFTITATGKPLANTKIGKVEFFIGTGLKQSSGAHTRYAPNLVSTRFLGAHSVAIADAAATMPVAADHAVAVHVVFVVTTKGRRTLTRNVSLSVPLSVYRTLP